MDRIGNQFLVTISSLCKSTPAGWYRCTTLTRLPEPVYLNLSNHEFHNRIDGSRVTLGSMTGRA